MANELDSLMKGLDTLVKNKTVIGDPIKIDDATIVPVMEVTFGMASGDFAQGNHSAGAMSARMTPIAMLVVQNGVSKVVQIKNTDAITKIVDMIPDFVNKVSGKKVSKEVVAKAKKLAEESDAALDIM